MRGQISNSWYGRTRFEIFSLKLLTFYKPCHSKTLLFDLNPEGAKSPTCHSHSHSHSRRLLELWLWLWLWLAVRYCTVPVYLRRGSILAVSQHPAHKKNQFWAEKYQKIRWESFAPIFWCCSNGRMQFSKWPQPNFRSHPPSILRPGTNSKFSNLAI